MKIFRRNRPEKAVPNENLNVGKVFDELAKLRLSDKYSVNLGGCGWFAYLVAKHFPGLKIYYKYPDDWQAVKSGRRGSACSHVIIFDGKKYWDSDGQHFVGNPKALHEVSLKYLEKSVNTKGIWNTVFKVSNVPEIEQKIKGVLQENSILV